MCAETDLLLSENYPYVILLLLLYKESGKYCRILFHQIPQERRSALRCPKKSHMSHKIHPYHSETIPASVSFGFPHLVSVSHKVDHVQSTGLEVFPVLADPLSARGINFRCP